MLERNVQIGRQQPFGHQRDHIINMRIGIDIMQPDPRGMAVNRAQSAQFASQIGHMRTHLRALPFARFVSDVDAIGRGILTDHQQFFRPGRNQLFSLAQHSINPPACQLST